MEFSMSRSKYLTEKDEKEIDEYIEKVMTPGPFQDAEIDKALNRLAEERWEQDKIDERNLWMITKFLFVAGIIAVLLKIIWF